MRGALCTWLGLVALGCGGSASDAPVPSRPAGPPAAFVAPAASTDDVVVAHVAGRPVWGSCVQHQVARGANSREAALAECIDFELMAQAAEARGFATDAEVIEATRTALVSRLVETGFEDRTRTAEQLREPLEQALAKNKARMNRPELRKSYHALAMVPEEKATYELDVKARRLADAIHAQLANETGLLPPHLEDTANRLAKDAGVELRLEEFPLTPKQNPRALQEYVDAVFAIPDVGRVSPVTRTKYGYHVILLTELVPAHVFTRDEFVEKFLPEIRRKEFQTWVDHIVRSLGVTIDIDLAPLEAEAAG